MVDVVVVVKAAASFAGLERRWKGDSVEDEAAMASSSLRLRLSLTRSARHLAEK